MKYLEILGASAPGPQRGSCLLSKSRTAFLAPLVPSFHMPYWNSVLSQSCQANGIAQTAWKNHCMRGRGGRFLETNTKEVWRGCGHIFSEEQKLKLQMFDTCWNLVQQTHKLVLFRYCIVVFGQERKIELISIATEKVIMLKRLKGHAVKQLMIIKPKI